MKDKLVKIVSFLIVFTPFLEPYQVAGLTFDTISLAFMVGYAMLKGRKTTGLLYGSRAFFLYALIIPNLVAILSGYGAHLSSSLIVIGLYMLVMMKVFPNASLYYITKYYRIFIYLTCFVFVLQEIMYNTMGYRFSALVPFFDIRYSGISMANFIQKQMFEARSSAFFLEPSHVAHYILPYLAISLGANTTKLSLKKFIEPVILSVVLFFLQSGCGIVGAISIWALYLLNVDMSKGKKVLFITASIIIGIFLFQKIMNTQIGENLMRRTTELDAEGDYERSGTIRIFRGFYVYSAMNVIQQVLGVGTGGSIDVIDNSPYRVMFFEGEHYLNNIQMFLIGFGLVGTFLFAIHYFKLFKRNSLVGQLVLIAFLSNCFLESFFMTSKMILFMVIAFLAKLEHDKNCLKKPSAIV